MKRSPSQPDPGDKVETGKQRAESEAASQVSQFQVSGFHAASASPCELSVREVDEGEVESIPVYDCWNTIGVAGNGSCQELLRLVHCRNCPVYAAAAIQLLDRPVIADYRREWSEHYAAEKKLTAPAKTSVVIFRIRSEWLALPTHAFQEVAERRVMHTLPHRRRDLVLGLVNVRGELLICVSLGQWLGLAEPGAGTKPETANRKPETQFPLSPFQLSALPHADRLLVANWEGNRIAFPVEEVHGVHRVYWEQLREPPATVVKSMHTYSRGVFSWRDHTVGFLDAEVLFSMLDRSLA